MNQLDDTDTTPDQASGDPDAEQLDRSDTLDSGSLADPLDQGYSPPDREPRVNVPTQAEQEGGESLDERLSEEEPDVGAGRDVLDDIEDDLDGARPSGAGRDEELYEVGDERAGRLVSADLGGYEDTEKELWAGDVGVDGAAASAEEAAVHVIDDGADDPRR